MTRTSGKDPAHITPDGKLIRRLIEGSVVRESVNIVTSINQRTGSTRRYHPAIKPMRLAR